jgi:outer membrane protein assembly factor BamB
METEIHRDIIYLGVKGTALALNRGNGEILWSTRLAGGEFVNLMLDGEMVLATTKGEIFCLDAKSGNLLWRNQLRGMGLGLITIATSNGSTSIAPPEAKRRKDQQAVTQ